MENESIDIIGVRYSLEDLKREDVRTMLSYVVLINKLLEIVISIIGIERCRNILTELIPNYKILEGSQITDKGTFIHPESIAALRKHSEFVGLSIVLGGFNIFITTILDTYGFLASSELSTAAIIAAASEVGKEQLKVIEASKTELEKRFRSVLLSSKRAMNNLTRKSPSAKRQKNNMEWFCALLSMVFGLPINKAAFWR